MPHFAQRSLLSLALVISTAGAQAASVACTAGVTGCDFANDGVFPAQGQEWLTETAWWQGLTDAVTFDLGGTKVLTGVELSLDNNDSYVIDVSSDGITWTSLAAVGQNQGSVGWGMDRFSTQADSPFFLNSLTFAPTQAAFVRVMATGGDNLYSVGEVALNVSAVPEAGTVTMLVSGLAALGGLSAVSRRRKQSGA